MSWIQNILRRGRDAEGDSPDSGNNSRCFDLLVTKGPDLGQRFTIDSDETVIGRGSPRPGQPGDVLLSDRHVSRSQAVIHRVDGYLIIEPKQHSMSPTLVNGKEVVSHRLCINDRISVGNDVLTVQASSRSRLSTLSLEKEKEATELDDMERTLSASASDMGTVIAQPKQSLSASLTVALGEEFCTSKSLAIGLGSTSIGRSPQCDITIKEPSVSRLHIELTWEDEKIFVVHKSGTNPTFINGQLLEKVGARVLFKHGDEIALCDSIRLVLDYEASAAKAAAPSSNSTSSSLTHKMKCLLDEERRINEMREELDERFKRTGSFLDIDVVDSTGLKSGEDNTAHIIVSFENFRSFVEKLVREYGGQVLNSNGDELMCFFACPISAVYCCEGIQDQIGAFNEAENLLVRNFAVRIGVHTGTSLVDLNRGKAYSNVLDVAGHLQKASGVGSYLISEETLNSLESDLPFEQGPGLKSGDRLTFQPTGPLPGRVTNADADA